MSDLDRAVDARIDAHRPEHVPPFEVIQARRARRNRTRAAGAAVLSAVAVAGIAFGATTLGAGSADRLPSYAGPADPSRATYVLRYEQGHPYASETDEAAVDACTALPGVAEVSVEQTLPPNYVVTVDGTAAQAEAFEDCAAALPGMTVVTQQQRSEHQSTSPTEDLGLPSLIHAPGQLPIASATREGDELVLSLATCGATDVQATAIIEPGAVRISVTGNNVEDGNLCGDLVRVLLPLGARSLPLFDAAGNPIEIR